VLVLRLPFRQRPGRLLHRVSLQTLSLSLSISSSSTNFTNNLPVINRSKLYLLDHFKPLLTYCLLIKSLIRSTLSDILQPATYNFSILWRLLPLLSSRQPKPSALSTKGLFQPSLNPLPTDNSTLSLSYRASISQLATGHSFHCHLTLANPNFLVNMSGKLDQSLDTILAARKKTARGPRRAAPRRGTSGAKAAPAAPVGGVKKTVRGPNKPEKKTNIPTGPARAESKIMVSNLV
jgi:hypothetical protein